ncbi:putative Mce family protein [Nocardia neocaledoniensis NBRC 108232]|uniref:Phospholipid/cholesterol/gamma-HCH transport system substrate-binding protein n=1 Tax=Nocardia neocaledoniensis TaxID=236511 RepID=A0A317N824_9NOCA|nr:MCE family protein [Nocardia neocaledoniensis]PWV71043.1 phospholipid/cholesterol/gamma-HCH transport system substrate-binding protein [Nocardia neocaledoniensis]GEM30290.1 putative Mce family protein [Nocardia neocaledoniensis NBRC 108232]
MTSVSGSAWRLALFGAAMIAVLALVVTAIQRPVAGDTVDYRAVFTDVNGLKTGDDIRLYGVQVGKVNDISLRGREAVVGFSVRTGTSVHDNSRLAIRYQNLTGQRYVDLQQPAAPAGRTPAGALIGVDRTVPSFDVTTLFNGLKPVLATLSPEALNQFTSSLLAVIEGDGNGIGPALAAIGTLSGYVADRQQLITTLISNLAGISDALGGRSQHLVTLLSKLADVFTSLQIKVNGLIDFAMTAPPVLGPVDSLLATFGLTEDENPDLANALRQAVPDPAAVAEIIGKLPSLLTGLRMALPATGSGVDKTCTKGAAEVPAPVAILFAGQQVSVCRG